MKVPSLRYAHVVQVPLPTSWRTCVTAGLPKLEHQNHLESLGSARLHSWRVCNLAEFWWGQGVAPVVTDSENHCSRDAHLGTRRRGHNHAKLWQLGRTGSDGLRLRIPPPPKNNLQASFSHSVSKRKSLSSRSPFFPTVSGPSQAPQPPGGLPAPLHTATHLSPSPYERQAGARERLQNRLSFQLTGSTFATRMQPIISPVGGGGGG